MRVLEGDNVNTLWPAAMSMLLTHGIRRNSRAGPVIEFPEPVCTVFHNPDQRVIFDPRRDANPFFHLMESIWMLAGRNDVAWLAQFNSNMRRFSDNGQSFAGAYGYRWRYYFGVDQLCYIASSLALDPTDRRMVLGMWDPYDDLCRGGFDIPCNTHIYFKVKEHCLDMTVCCRSNDIIWGLFGANCVHMSVLHEWMSVATGYKMGVYRQISDSFHAYQEVIDEWLVDQDFHNYDCYGDLLPTPLVQESRSWLAQAEAFVEGIHEVSTLSNPFWQDLAIPAWMAWQDYKTGNLEAAFNRCQEIKDHGDWSLAMSEWIYRRIQRRAK